MIRSTMSQRRTLAHTLFVTTVYTFLYIPIVIMVVYSFNNATFPAPWQGFTLDWYRALWYESDTLWEALSNSLIISCSAMILSVIMGVCVIFYHAQHGRVSHMIRFFYVNLIVPEVVLAVGLLSLFSIAGISLGKMTLVIAHTVLGLGYVIPIIYTRYQELDYRLTEASLDLGATYGQTFRRIILPLLYPALMVAGLLVFIISFDDFVLSYFCAGPSATTLPLYILSMLKTGISPVVSALSTGLLVVSSLLVVGFCSLALRTRML